MSENSIITKSKKGNKPAEPKSTIDIQVLWKENVKQYLLPNSLVNASKDSSLLTGKKVVSLFDLVKLIEWKPNEIEDYFYPYLPRDILDLLVYERRREQKLSERKQREANEIKEKRDFNEMKITESKLLEEKRYLKEEIFNYKLLTGECTQNNELQETFQQHFNPMMQDFIQPVYSTAYHPQRYYEGLEMNYPH